MPQIKVEKNGNYTTVTNAVLQNPELSLKAKGLLLYMLSLPADWDYSIGGLASKCKEGATAIRSAIQELIDAGHVVRRQRHADNGVWDGYEYTVYESPQPSCENPTTESASTENRTEQNNNITKQELNKPPIVPQGGRRASMPKYQPEWFEALWKVYPTKKSRQDACRAWDKLKPDHDFALHLHQQILLQKQSEDWRKENGRYVPHFSRWLNGGLWEDEMRPAAPDFGDGGYWDPEVTD